MVPMGLGFWPCLRADFWNVFGLPGFGKTKTARVGFPYKSHDLARKLTMLLGKKSKKSGQQIKP